MKNLNSISYTCVYRCINYFNINTYIKSKKNNIDMYFHFILILNIKKILSWPFYTHTRTYIMNLLYFTFFSMIFIYKIGQINADCLP